jgi:hypothetical protein
MMMTTLFKTLLSALIVVNAATCFANSVQQALGGHVGGGDATASDIQNFINQVD